MSSKTGVSHVVNPYSTHRKRPKQLSVKAGNGLYEMLLPLAKKALSNGASAACGSLAKVILGNGVTRSGDGVTRSGDGRRKKKRGGCADCTTKLKNQLSKLKL